MRKEFIILVAAFFIMSLTAFSAVYALEEEKKPVLITEKTADITGDGEEESIYLKGIEYQEDSLHFKTIFLEVREKNGRTHNMEFDGGFEPAICLKDFNDDGVKDVLVTINTGGSGGILNHHLYSLKDSKVTDLMTPEPLVISGQFLDKYKAKITIENNHKSHKFDLKERAKDYELNGLYHNGKLNEPTELIMGGFDRLKPIKIKGKKWGLRGNQTISGAAHADVIGRVESTWILKNGVWVLLSTKVFEANMKQQK
ncbi:hypothetical protein [Robertmurraya andreesenii]|uniref:VCBS repeat-containing protein n=1 Tax=Anoxybacillus andreesenii TaxID=1325932 RepID=A0ABT9V0P3_9BACL|nr:hypothetical protein [Robertmurraya andreesenii]MDQ0154523.1 hypothetical protein [Robertmurraya andreesenii]